MIASRSNDFLTVSHSRKRLACRRNTNSAGSSQIVPERLGGTCCVLGVSVAPYCLSASPGGPALLCLLPSRSTGHLLGWLVDHGARPKSRDVPRGIVVARQLTSLRGMHVEMSTIWPRRFQRESHPQVTTRRRTFRGFAGASSHGGQLPNPGNINGRVRWQDVTHSLRGVSAPLVAFAWHSKKVPGEQRLSHPARRDLRGSHGPGKSVSTCTRLSVGCFAVRAECEREKGVQWIRHERVLSWNVWT